MALFLFFAFLRARLAYFCAVLADQVDEFTIALHEIDSKTADGGAIPIQRYAT
jgi:hypothetical protein